MKMNAWMKFGAIGFAVSLFAAGCVVTSTSDTDGGLGGFAGSATGGSGGSATGGSGGSATGGSGGSATGGSGGSATGGSGGALTCNPSASGNSKCDTCMQTTCCNEWEACFNDAQCTSEFTCIKNCVDQELASDAGTADVAGCASQCTPADAGTISDKTNALVICARDTEGGASCGVDCFGGF